jgi:membrane protein
VDQKNGTRPVVPADGANGLLKRVVPTSRFAASAAWALLGQTAARWSQHKASLLGAALAYYSVFSLGPLMVIAIAIAGFVFGKDAAHGEVATQLHDLLGGAGSQAAESMLAGAGRPRSGLLAATLGVATLIFAAVAIVYALKEALNTVWDVTAPPTGGIWSLLRGYAVSLIGVLAVGFLLLASLLVTTVAAAGAGYVTPWVSPGLLHAANTIISFAIVSVLFAMMFKWLPDAQIEWRDVWLGAMMTAVLFEIGKVLIGFYVGKQALESTYGAASSIVVVLIWVYYNAQLVLAGAEFTRAYAEAHGSRRRDGWK